MRPVQTEELHERYRATGYAEALGAVFDAIAPELLPRAVRLAPSVVETEDLVQGAFLGLLERLEPFRRGP